MLAFKTVLNFCIIASVLGQGFPPYRQPVEQFATRRQQLTPVQQSHILTDIQQHQHQQHRFNVNQQNHFNGPKNFQGSKPQFSQSLPQRQYFAQPQTGPGLNQYAPQPTSNSFRVGPPQNQQRPVGQNQFVNFQTNGQQIPQLQQNPQFIQQQAPVQQQQHFQRSVQNQLHTPSLTNPAPQNNVRFPPPQQQTVQITQTVGQQLPTITTFQAPQAQALVGQPQVINPSQAPFVGSQPISASLPIANPSAQPQFFPNGASVVISPTANIYPFPQQPQVQVQNQFQQQPQFIAQAPVFAPNFPVTGPQSQGQFIPSSGIYQPDPKFDEDRYRLLKEKERIIQKHEQFVQKHQLKQQQKVQQLHQEFLDGQQKIKQHTLKTIKSLNNSPYVPRYTQARGVLPGEVNLFQKAVQAYQEVNPTSTSTTTTTPSPIAVTSSDILRVPKQKSGKAQEITISTQEQLEQLLQGQHVFGQLKNPKSKSKAKSTKGLGRDDLIKQLKLALAEQPVDLGNQNYTSEDIVLPDGQKVQVIRTSDPSLIPSGSTTVNAPGNGYPDLPSAQSASVIDSSVLPPGSDYELVKQSDDGKLEPVQNVPNQKKVTFVYLEEQDDGSYKIQGVKGSNDKEAKTSGTEVDSILKRIKEGDIKLPGSVGITSNAPLLPTTIRDTPIISSSTTPRNPSSVSASDYDDVFYSTPRSNAVRSTNTKSVLQSLNPASSSTKDFLGVTVTKSYRGSSTAAPSSAYTPSIYTHSGHVSTVAPPQAAPLVETTNNIEATTLPAFSSSSSAGTTTTERANDLTDILRTNGLHAMAKYLKQSGLDTILNETGPYTVFAPTDKAFRALLVQLGGPEKAEEKFKHNPRLLSGLLLHHVIPGSFEISALQDEMTGVSLAGTQLRVNQYKLHDSEWNDIQVTTINGAAIVTEKQDIVIPQGVAHGVDRVMFPLPVGDLLQTLQSDRERRFTNFLRAIFTANMAELLQSKGIKTYTVFAPTDDAFSKLSSEELTNLVTNKDLAEKLVTKHLVNGSLFSAGMRFYQIKDSMASGAPLTLQKTNGKVKVNDGNVVTSNIPATNGVIHAIDLLL